jgi:hypothetical protein
MDWAGWAGEDDYMDFTSHTFSTLTRTGTLAPTRSLTANKGRTEESRIILHE